MERIRLRIRDVESGISLDYIKMLYQEYETFIQSVSKTIPVIRVSWEQYRNAEEMAAVIEREYLKSNFIRNVEWNPVDGI